MVITEQFYRTMIENMMNGFALHSIVTDNNGNPVDYRYIQINRAFEELTGLKRMDVIGKTICEIVPTIEEDTISWIKFFGKVALSGESASTEQYSATFDRWYSVNAFCPERGYFIAVFMDITQLKKQTQKLQKKNQQLKKLYDNQKNLYREMNDKKEELSSLYEEILASEEELRQQNDELYQKKEELTALYEELTSQEEELRSNYERLNDSMLRLKKSEAINNLILEASSEGVWQYDLADNIYSIPSKFVESLGYRAEEMTSIMKIHEIIHPEDKEYSERNFNEHMIGNVPKYESEFRLVCKDGSHRWVKSSGKVLKDDSGRPYLMAGSFVDVTRLKEQQKELEHLAYYDILTDLPNRTLFLIELEKAQLRADEDNRKLAVLYMDLDNFKDVNDMLGHSTGDRLLQTMADRLRKIIPEKGIVTRLGGDEFVLLINDIDSEQDVYDYCLRIKKMVLEPFEFHGYRLSISSSMGVVIYPDIPGTSEDLLKSADAAMYRAKNMGKNTIQFYRDSIRADILKRLTIENRMREALYRNCFTLHYQPQICLKTGKIRAFEALLRWTDEELGTLSPVEFIPIAESSGLIVPMGEWILFEACRQAKELYSGNTGILVSVNISAIQLKQTDFAEQVKKVLKMTGLPARCLELELTETSMISSFDTSVRMLEELRGLGIKMSLDDFGTGYSSLSYLKKLPIDTLKIDKSFINDLDSDQTENEIAGTIISLVHKLDIEVIAEGVETGQQLSYLHKYDCDSIQGYLMSRPVPAWKVPEVIMRDFAAEIGSCITCGNGAEGDAS